MFGWEFPPQISGGLGTACSGITRALSESGEEIIFVAPTVPSAAEGKHLKFVSAAAVPGVNAGEEAAVCDFGEDLRFLAVNSLLSPYLNYREYQTRRALSQLYAPEVEMAGDYGPNLLAEVFRYGKAALTIAQEESFDIVHGHDWMTVLACLQARRISGKPYVYHVHALESDRSGANGDPVIRALEKSGLDAADRVIAVSRYTKEKIVRDYDLSPEKIVVVHNAVSSRCGDPPWELKTTASKVVLFLGRITFQKGPSAFVKAASMVIQAMPEVRFVMAGTGDMMEQTIEKVAEYRLGAKFHFTGFLCGEEVERIFALSDLYVMPSVSEPFGLAALEAMRHDVPVIIARQSGVREVLHHALTVDFWNIGELADKMLAVLRHPPLGRMMSAGARDDLKKISWEKSAERIRTLYREMRARC